MNPVIEMFNNEYNSPIVIGVHKAGPHRHVTIEIRSHKSRSSWDVTEMEARKLSNALIEYLAQSPYEESR